MTGRHAIDRGSLWWRVVLLRDYNTRIVVVGAGLLGIAAGLTGCFALLRKRALLGDAVSHATLPGIGIAWLIGYSLGYDQKLLLWLLLGAAVTGVAGTLTILAIRRTTRLQEDAALGIVLGVFFGAGVALLGLIQKLPAGSAAGLRSFVDGKAASLSGLDVGLIAGALVLCLLLIALYYKELCLLCFDDGFATSMGFPVLVLEILLMSLIVLVTIVGLQAVGLVLMVALLVIPPAAARFWTHRLPATLAIAACIGGFSSAVGALVSGLVPDLPSGPLIVLVAAGCFGGSLLFGYRRGMVQRWWSQWRLSVKTGHDHLLRALFELEESLDSAEGGRNAGEGRKPGIDGGSRSPWLERGRLLRHRSWSRGEMGRILRRAERAGDVQVGTDGQVRLTEAGRVHAARVAREHRLWEMYLIAYADVAPGRVDRGADAIEHVLGPVVVARLEELLDLQQQRAIALASPHPIGPEQAASAEGRQANGVGIPEAGPGESP